MSVSLTFSHKAHAREDMSVEKKKKKLGGDMEKWDNIGLSLI